MAARYYVNSGHFEPRDAVLVVGVWTPVVWVAALAYAAVQTWDPGVFFSAGSHAALGFGIGWGLGYVLKWRHIRSHGFLALAAAGFGAFAWFVQVLEVKTKLLVDNLMIDAASADALRKKLLFRKGDPGLSRKAG